MGRYLSYNLILFALLCNGSIVCGAVSQSEQIGLFYQYPNPVYWQTACYVGPWMDLYTQPGLCNLITQARHAVYSALLAHNIFGQHTVYYYANTDIEVMIHQYLFRYDLQNNELKFLSGSKVTKEKLAQLPKKDGIVFQVDQRLITPENYLEYVKVLYWRRKVEHKLNDLRITPPQPLTSVIFDTQYPMYSTIFYGDERKAIDYNKYLKKFGFLDKKTGCFTVMPLSELRKRVGCAETQSIK